MKISYAIRSKFTAPCKESIATQQTKLDAGQVIHIPLTAGGYTGQAAVTIKGDSVTMFETDWKGRDPTRFPARIKAAATALWECGNTGTFAVTYADEIISIQYALH